MFKNLLFIFSVCAIAPVFNAGCQSVSVNPEIEVSNAVLKTAETFDFKYMDVLAKAKTGNTQSIQEFIRFNKYVDEMEGINHGLSCLELIPFATDTKFAAACKLSSVNLRKLLAERLQQAQGKTKKEDLRKPLKDWAPLTYAALNTVENTPDPNAKLNDPSMQNVKKAGTTEQPAEQAKPATDAGAKPDRNGGK